jgi:hypothetical protein
MRFDIKIDGRILDIVFDTINIIGGTPMNGINHRCFFLFEDNRIGYIGPEESFVLGIIGK